MKRAEVWRKDPGCWHVCAGANLPITCKEFRTHAAALAHALAEVGLDRPAEHREAP